MGIKNQEMRSEKRKPYLVIKQASKDYAKTFFKKNLVLWYNEHLLDEFIKKIQLTNSIKKNYLKLIPFDEFEICIILLEKGGYSKVYLASWNDGLYFEAPNNVREFGLQSKKNLKSDRVVARLEYDITEGNISFSFSDKSTTGSQCVVLKQLKNSIMELILYVSKKFYGIIIPITPEILSNIGNDDEKEEIYTKASDVYSFAMIMWELTSGQQSFVHFSHDENLIKEIINGLRPEIIKGTPKSYLDLMIKCWDNSPLNRPNINEIIEIIENWKIQWNLNPEIIEVAEIERKELVKSNDWILFNNYKNPEAFYFSRDLNF
ncbi:hypothetical protein RhiirA5_505298 [Rhizophagus irregularis]|uniref:Protein kinase domain-containing protein n=1 Tax=Rhizophagus irregularis TaxID=588596 RepID=A0A2N0P0A7_9GLOM|nr:hypothetical protein RhiirA5_505298 [Rhizophagus irregularis]